MNAESTTLRTVERALQVLELVAESTTPLQVKDVAESLSHNITSTYHLVNTLVTKRYLNKTSDGLSLGRKIALLSDAYFRTQDFTQSARPAVLKLADLSAETVYLTRFTDSTTVIEIVEESTSSLRVTGLNIGYSGLDDRRASGKAVIAHLGAEDREKVFQKLYASESERAAAIRSVEEELADIRERGYAFDNEAYEAGVCCVAAPFFLLDGSVGGAVAASAPAIRRDRLLSDVLPQVLRAANEVSRLA